jgi:hypothetical protein
MSTTPYGVITHNTPVKESSWMAGAALVKADPVEIDFTKDNTVKKCGADSDAFLGVSNENKDANLPV